MPTIRKSEPPRTRSKGGTRVHLATTVDEFVAACRDVLEHGFAKVNGETMDSTTAGAMVAVWDALTERNREHTRAFYARRFEKYGERGALHSCVGLFWKFVR